LKLLGYQVFEADGSESARRFFHEASPPDIVISDVQMPGVMDGIGLRHWIQTRYPKVRVILSSGYSESHFEIGEDFLPKPFSLDALAAILDGKTNS
jgi:YesN/AraC family two-component response regulator